MATHRERALANPNQDDDAVYAELERYLRTQHRGLTNIRVTDAIETEDWELKFNPPKLWHKVVFTADDLDR